MEEKKAASAICTEMLVPRSSWKLSCSPSSSWSSSMYHQEPERYRIGHTKIFFRAGVLGHMEDVSILLLMRSHFIYVEDIFIYILLKKFNSENQPNKHSVEGPSGDQPDLQTARSYHRIQVNFNFNSKYKLYGAASSAIFALSKFLLCLMLLVFQNWIYFVWTLNTNPKYPGGGRTTRRGWTNAGCLPSYRRSSGGTFPFLP